MRNFLFLLVLFLFHDLNSQSTAELYSLPGLTMVLEDEDDTGQVTSSALFYIGEVDINGVSYLEFQNANCFKSHFRIDNGKVYQRNLLSGEDETLRYDFSLEVGDSIHVPLFFHPGGFMDVDLTVTQKSTVVFLDGRERIRIELVSDFFNGSILWVEGLGDFRQIRCAYDDQGSIFLSGISQEDCEARSCKSLTLSFDHVIQDNSIQIINNSSHEDSITYDLGDGTILTDVDEFTYEYSQYGCKEITVKAFNECSGEVHRSLILDFCSDSSWVKFTDENIRVIDFFSEDKALALISGTIYSSNDGGLNWVSEDLGIPDSISYDFHDINIYDESYGAITIEGYDLDFNLLVTRDGGDSWQPIRVAERFYNPNVKLGVDGRIVIVAGKHVHVSSDYGETWKESVLSESNLYPDAIHLGPLGHIIIATYNDLVEPSYTSIYLSDNNGENFTFTKSFEIGIVPSISFVDDQIGYFLETRGVWKTIDRGLNWIQIKSYKDRRTVKGLHFYSESEGIMVTTDRVYRTQNGGLDWTPEYCYNNSRIHQLFVFGDKEFLKQNGLISTYEPDPDFDCITSTESPREKDQITVFPSPTSSLLHLRGGLPNDWIRAYNNQGQLIFSTSYKEQLDLREITKGLYYLTIEKTNGQRVTTKFIKI